MTPAWIAAVASVTAAAFAGMGLRLQVIARRPHVEVNWGAIGTEGRITVTLSVRNVGDHSISALQATPLLDGAEAGRTQGPTGLLPGANTTLHFDLASPDQAEFDAAGFPTFHGKRFAVRLRLGWRRKTIPYGVREGWIY